MKLRYYFSPETNKKTYTLEETIDGKQTKPAHYKFSKLYSRLKSYKNKNRET